MTKTELFDWLEFMVENGFWVDITLKKTPENLSLIRELIKKHRRIVTYVNY